MTFEAGPWYCFGKELLDRLHTFVNKKKSLGNNILNYFKSIRMKRKN